jgi:hypothetical protein
MSAELGNYSAAQERKSSVIRAAASTLLKRVSFHDRNAARVAGASLGKFRTA